MPRPDDCRSGAGDERPARKVTEEITHWRCGDAGPGRAMAPVSRGSVAMDRHHAWIVLVIAAPIGGIGNAKPLGAAQLRHSQPAALEQRGAGISWP